MLGYASVIERNWFVLRSLEVPMLPEGARPLRLLHISDAHLTPGRHRLLSWIRSLDATDPDLVIATKGAIQEMIDFLVAEKHLTRHQAYQLVSVAGNVAITQLVDKPNLGVHVRLPKSIFTKN